MGTRRHHLKVIAAAAALVTATISVAAAWQLVSATSTDAPLSDPPPTAATTDAASTDTFTSLRHLGRALTTSYSAAATLAVALGIVAAIQLIAVRRTRSRTAQDAERHLQRLISAQLRITGTGLSLSTLARTVCDEVTALAGSSGAAFSLIEGDDIVVTAACGVLESTVGSRHRRSEGLRGTALESGSLCVSEDVTTDSRVDHASAVSSGARSAMVLPMNGPAGPLGTVTIVWSDPQCLHPAITSALAALAATAATATTGCLELVQLADMNAALAYSENRWRTIFDSAPSGIACTDGTGRIVAANDALCRLSGYSSSDLVGRSAIDLLAEGDRGSILERDHSTGGQVQVRLRHAQGHLVWVAVSLSALGAAGGTHQWLAHIVDITENKLAEARLQYLVEHDPMTGTVNRRGLHVALEREVAQVARYRTPATVLILDVDRFKSVNDTYGHPVGDEVIIAVAAALRSVLRDSDVVARLGGDEFAVVLTHTDTAAAETAAAKIVAAIEALEVPTKAGLLKVTTSVGIAGLEPGECASDEVMVNADLALYAAKAAGRNGYSSYHPGLRTGHSALPGRRFD